ncbi:MAG: hypothetical protein K8R25_00050 [Methanosarcinales archaeon]|nr:hypothetical protein [Methanosarcinales archaeon]
MGFNFKDLIITLIFSNLHKQGRTFVMITHDPEIAEFADRMVLVKDGLIENN